MIFDRNASSSGDVFRQHPIEVTERTQQSDCILFGWGGGGGDVVKEEILHKFNIINQDTRAKDSNENI